MTTNETLAADAAETTVTTQRGGGMSKREAVFRLLEISKNRELGVDDVIAIQTAVRSLCKRIFDGERHMKRRRAAAEALLPVEAPARKEAADE